MTDFRMEAAAREGQLDDPRVKAFLDDLPVATVISMIGSYTVSTKVLGPIGGVWKAGMDKPMLADPDPAIMSAIGRCAAARLRNATRPAPMQVSVTHPYRCGWCDYPQEELIAALDWATLESRLITEEWMTWEVDGQHYRRPTGRAGQYANPAWEGFRRMPPADQTAAVNQAMENSRG